MFLTAQLDDWWFSLEAPHLVVVRQRMRPKSSEDFFAHSSPAGLGRGEHPRVTTARAPWASISNPKWSCHGISPAPWLWGPGSDKVLPNFKRTVHRLHFLIGALQSSWRAYWTVPTSMAIFRKNINNLSALLLATTVHFPSTWKIYQPLPTTPSKALFHNGIWLRL